MDYYSVGYPTPHAMPMFNFLCCQLCELNPAQKHGLCLQCWQDLPWAKAEVTRQEQKVWVACYYHYPIDRLIQQFKYEQQLHYQPLLAALLDQIRYSGIQAIVPMPISNQRLQQRGFNQSVLLSQTLSRRLRIPIWQPIIRLAEHAQKGLSRQERLQGIQQQFQAQPSQSQSFKRVLIVDDVVTTGSSIHSLSIQLQNLGCERIQAACLAAAEQ